MKKVILWICRILDSIADQLDKWTIYLDEKSQKVRCLLAKY